MHDYTFSFQGMHQSDAMQRKWLLFSLTLTGEERYLQEREERKKEGRIQVMTGIALGEVTLALLNHSLSLSASLLLSFTVSIRCCFVQCEAWPHVMPPPHNQSALRLNLLLRQCHSRFHGPQNCNGVTQQTDLSSKSRECKSYLLACQLAPLSSWSNVHEQLQSEFANKWNHFTKV